MTTAEEQMPADRGQPPVAQVVPEWLQRGQTRLKLQTIVRLRWLAVMGQTITVIGVYWLLGLDLPLPSCLIAIAASAWLNVILRLRYPASQRLPASFAMVMLGYDILQLSALLYLTGGLENPFAFLLVAPVTVSAATQTPRVTLLLGGLAVLLATLLTVHHYPLPWFDQARLSLPFFYVLGIWAAVVAGILFIGFYSWRTAEEGRRMAEALAAAEMVLAREQRLTALDGLAAAAAHELGTPLSTIALAAKEMKDDIPPGPLAEDVELIIAQAARCRAILAKLRSLKSGDVGDPFAAVRLEELLEEVATPLETAQVRIDIELEGGANEPIITRNVGLLYGLGNLIENAVQFAHSRVTVRAQWDRSSVSVEIADDGPGFAEELLARLGEPYLTTRARNTAPESSAPGGLGLGVFIAKTLIGRSGGGLEFDNAPGAGARVRIRWPRRAIEA